MSRGGALAWWLAPVLIPLTLHGQSRWERQVATHLAQAGATLAANGYVARSTVRGGALDNAETASDTVTLTAGFTYALVGVCDDDCRGLELSLYAANGYEVDAARRAGNAPILRVTPRATMVYRFTVRMSGCGRNPCWFGVRVYRRMSDGG